MSNKPSIIFNPDYNRLVLDPLTNRLVTAGELSKKTAPPAPVVKPAAVASKPPVPPAPVSKPVVAAKPPAPPAPVSKPVVPAKAPVTPAPVAKPVVPAKAPVAKPVVAAKAPVSKPVVAAKAPVAKPVVKQVKFDISASLDVPAPKLFNKGPLVIPFRGGYGAVILGRGRR